MIGQSLSSDLVLALHLWISVANLENHLNKVKYELKSIKFT